MSRFTILATILLLAPALNAQPKAKPNEPKSSPSKVAKVTVYPNSALVTREVEVTKGEGLTEVIVSPLPARIVANSLFSEGSDGLRILST